jgi:hypothetical protein
MDVLSGDPFDEVFEQIYPLEARFQDDVAALYFDVDVVLRLDPDLGGDTLRDSNGQTVAPFLRSCVHASFSHVDTADILCQAVCCVKVQNGSVGMSVQARSFLPLRQGRMDGFPGDMRRLA